MTQMRDITIFQCKIDTIEHLSQTLEDKPLRNKEKLLNKWLACQKILF
jgi:hypothetical protein